MVGFAVVVGGEAEVLADVFAEEGEVVKAHLGGDFLDTHVAVEQQLLDAADNSGGDEVAGGVVAVLTAHAGEVFGRDAQLVGIGFDTAVDVGVIGEQ